MSALSVVAIATLTSLTTGVLFASVVDWLLRLYERRPGSASVSLLAASPAPVPSFDRLTYVYNVRVEAGFVVPGHRVFTYIEGNVEPVIFPRRKGGFIPMGIELPRGSSDTVSTLQ